MASFQDYSILGRAGVALVEMQLLRRGIECFRTPEGSAVGDIWAETAVGKIGIEVKTTNASRSWFVRLSQQRSDFFALVRMDDLSTFIVTRDEMGAVCAGMTDANGVIKLPANRLPAEWKDAWGKFSAPPASKLRCHDSLQSPKGYRAHRPHAIRSWVRQDGQRVYAVKRGTGPHKSERAARKFEIAVNDLRGRGLLIE